MSDCVWWTIACQAPLSMGFSRQEYWSGLPFPSLGDLPDPGTELESPVLHADSLPSEPSGKSLVCVCVSVCAHARGGQGGQVGECGTEETGVGTHANEGDELLIRVFIRAVRRDRRVLQWAGETAWRARDRSFPRFTEALREPRHHLPSSLCPQDGRGSLQKEAKAPIMHALPSAPTSVPRGRPQWVGAGPGREEKALLSWVPTREMRWGGGGCEKAKEPKIYLAHPTCFQESIPGALTTCAYR